MFEHGQVRFWLQAEHLSPDASYRFVINDKEVSDGEVRPGRGGGGRPAPRSAAWALQRPPLTRLSTERVLGPSDLRGPVGKVAGVKEGGAFGTCGTHWRFPRGRWRSCVGWRLRPGARGLGWTPPNPERRL